MRPARSSALSDSLSEEAFLSLDSMEGVYSERVVERRAAAAVKTAPRESIWPGVLMAASVAAVSYGLHYLPVAPFRMVAEGGVRRPISAAILAILIAALIRNVLPVPGSILLGAKAIVRRMIPVTIVLTGAGLNLSYMAALGLKSLSITVICCLVATAAAYYLGRAFGLWRRTALLIGAGTAICGTSAIVAVAPLIDAEDEDVTLSVGAISLLGLIWMFLLPLAGGLLGLGDEAFGVWAGTSIHAVPQVVAAGFAYSAKAGTVATLVKLVRVALLAPFLFLLTVLQARRRSGGEVTVHYSRLVPGFVWGFVGATLVNTAGLLPALQFRVAPWLWGGQFQLALGPLVAEAANLLLTLAMAAIGLEVNLRLLAGVGARTIAAGAAAGVVLTVVSLGLIRAVLGW